MKILWIGKFASNTIFEEMTLKGYKDPAAQQSQSNIIYAFDHMGVSLDTINAYNVSFDYKDSYLKPQAWSRTGRSTDVSVGYYNLKYLNHLLITQALRSKVREWAKDNLDEQVKIIVYGMQSSLLSAANLAKEIIPNSVIVQIVPDLPQFMDSNMSRLKRLLKKVDWYRIKHSLSNIDGFVLYTEHMAEYLNLKPKSWILMEGSISLNEIDNDDFEDKFHENIIMYSGKIDKTFGVIELLEATKLISDENFEFWFTGFGNALDVLFEYMRIDKRIKYLGFFPSRADLLRQQKSATMLMNMRLPTEHGSSYCFPSKIFEYMASGIPVLSFKVNGIPEEYYEFLIEMKSSNPADIADKILEVSCLSAEDRKNIGQKARHFVLEEKNSLVQTGKILDFINRLI